MLEIVNSAGGPPPVEVELSVREDVPGLFDLRLAGRELRDLTGPQVDSALAQYGLHVRTVD